MTNNAPQPAPAKGNPGKPSGNDPANVREPSNTRPPSDPTPDRTPKPQQAGRDEDEETTDIQTDGN